MIKSYPINPRFFVIVIFGAPLIEIASFIFVGKEIGILATLSLIILTTVVGSILLRIQGISILKNIQRELIQGRTLENYIINDAFIIIGAILLIVPGFVSDILGILLLIKPVRKIIWYLFLSFNNNTSSYHKNNDNTKNKFEKIIELKEEEYQIHNVKESPWRKNDNNH
ncbi:MULTISPECIES: FxsA family protein [unclassified Bartonella]|uniref:FxsA family protein n=1 Tax=unclassified Bartonella TaxID=2645622 RepID=UPI00300DF2DF